MDLTTGEGDYDLEVDLRISDDEDIGTGEDHDSKFAIGSAYEEALLADTGDEEYIGGRNNSVINQQQRNNSSERRAVGITPSRSTPIHQPTYWIDRKRRPQKSAPESQESSSQRSIPPQASSAALLKDGPKGNGSFTGEKFSKVRDNRNLVEYGDLGADILDDSEDTRDETTGNLPARPPSSYFKGRKFDHDNPIKDRRRFNVDPRANMALDDIIRQNKEQDRFVRKEASVFKPHRRINKFDSGSGRREHYNEEQRQQKLRLGLRSLVEVRDAVQPPSFDGSGGDVQHELEPQNMTSIGTWTQGSWDSIMNLTHRGYGIYWSVKTLKCDENPPNELAGRLWKCVVSYGDIIGVSESSNMWATKHGAAANFLKGFAERFPTSGRRFPTEVDESIYINPKVLNILCEKLRTNYPDLMVLARFRTNMERQGSQTIYLATLSICSRYYKGASSTGYKTAKVMAAKLAYEDLLKERCPMLTIFQGAECTTPDSFYREFESEMTHCYDFGQLTVLDSDNFRRSCKGRHNYVSRNGRRVLVSYEQPDE